MPSILSAQGVPAVTNIANAAETLAANIGPSQLNAPPNATAVTIRGTITITTGASVTALQAKLRNGVNNTSTAQMGIGEQVPAIASQANSECPFEFVDVNLADLGANGYSLTITQIGATGAGTITQVDYDVDFTVP